MPVMASAAAAVTELRVGCGGGELEELAERIPEAAEVVLEDALVRDGGERVGPLGTPVLDSLTAYTRSLGTLGVPSTRPRHTLGVLGVPAARVHAT